MSIRGILPDFIPSAINQNHHLSHFGDDNNIELKTEECRFYRPHQSGLIIMHRADLAEAF